MLSEKTIGKPYAGNPHVRFDEGPLVCTLCTTDWGLLHSAGGGRFARRECPSAQASR